MVQVSGLSIWFGMGTVCPTRYTTEDSRRPICYKFWNSRLASNIGSKSSERIFVGDNPVIDIDGCIKAKMQGVLYDKYNYYNNTKYLRIKNLNELTRILNV